MRFGRRVCVSASAQTGAAPAKPAGGCAGIATRSWLHTFSGTCFQ
jgi:hypothetical protein